MKSQFRCNLLNLFVILGTSMIGTLTGCSTQASPTPPCVGPGCLPVSADLESYEQYCDNVARELCTATASCFGGTTNVEDCRAGAMALWICPPRLKQSVIEGRLRFDSAKAEACLLAAKNTAETCAISQALIVCSNTYVGLVASGEICYGSVECADRGPCASGQSQMCPGVCQPPVPVGSVAYSSEECEQGRVLLDGKCSLRGKIGETCDPFSCGEGYCDENTRKCKAFGRIGDACRERLHCGWGPVRCGAAGKCEALKELNEACTDPDSCVYGLYCHLSASGSGTCRTHPKLGEACLNDECSSSETCHPVRKVCVPRFPRDLPVGAECAYTYQCSANAYCSNKVCQARGAMGAVCPDWDSCRDGLTCNDQTKICEPRAQLNESCQQKACAPDLRCDYSSNKCIGRTGKGTSCVLDNHCISGLFCLTNTCQAPQAAGGACQLNKHCQTDLYCDLDKKQCQPRLSRGESCSTSSDQCRTGYCDFATKKCALKDCYTPTN